MIKYEFYSETFNCSNLNYFQINSDVCKILGMKTSLCFPYHPQTNGLEGKVQRCNLLLLITLLLFIYVVVGNKDNII